MNSLLADLEEARHQHLLEKGNLAPKRRAPEQTRFTEWRDSEPWTPRGFVLQLEELTCPACGEISEHSMGLFSLETKGGAQRYSAILPDLSTVPQDSPFSLSTAVRRQALCVACIKTHFHKD